MPRKLDQTVRGTTALCGTGEQVWPQLAWDSGSCGGCEVFVQSGAFTSTNFKSWRVCNWVCFGFWGLWRKWRLWPMGLNQQWGPSANRPVQLPRWGLLGKDSLFGTVPAQQVWPSAHVRPRGTRFSLLTAKVCWQELLYYRQHYHTTMMEWPERVTARLRE